MSNVVQDRYTIATHGLRARYNPLVRVYPSASPRVYTLTHGLWARNPLLAIVYPIRISREISIEHPSVGLASLAQLLPARASEQGNVIGSVRIYLYK